MMTMFQSASEFAMQGGDLRPRGSVFCIGNFDGVHLGHQSLLQKARELGIRDSLPWGLLTFKPHPLKILQPQRFQGNLFSEVDQQQQLEKWGANFIVRQPFDAEFSELEPEVFVQKILHEQLAVQAVVVGYNFRFGRRRTGDVNLLVQLGKKWGFQVCALEAQKISYQGQELVVSTSFIREQLVLGELEKAQAALGRNFSFTARVIHGAKKGRQLGFPTVNMQTPLAQALRTGVYISRVLVDQNYYFSVSNVGYKPTVQASDSKPLLGVETHIFNFNQDLYERELKIEFLKFIRDEKKFNSLEELKRQIAEDLQVAQDYIRKGS